MSFRYRTKTPIEFKTRHYPVPITPYRSTSLLRRDVSQTCHVAGKAYTLPRRQQQQQPSPLRSFAGYSPTSAATPPLTGTRLVTSGDGGLTVWLGDEDINIDERLSPSTARCTCTLRRVVASRPPATSASAASVVLRGHNGADTPTSFTTFKPASTSTVADVVRASPLMRSSASDRATFYDRPLFTSQRDDTGGGTDHALQH